MNTPTIEEMKLAVARLLPGEIELVDAIICGDIDQKTGAQTSKKGQKAQWKDTGRFVGGREWLHVCWLVERKLTNGEYRDYVGFLEDATGVTADILVLRRMVSAEYEIRLQALCRLKCPEIFQSAPTNQPQPPAPD